MDKNKTTNLIIIVIIIVIGLFIISINKPRNQTTEEIAKCIGEKSELYIQLGCHYCEIQKEMFGENYQYLKVIDCFYEREKCANINGTPTWIIKGQSYEGLQEIKTLRNLTGC